jgi:hypothetical protein
MTWDEREDAAIVEDSRGALVATVNSFVIANAETQWFSCPDQKIYRANGMRTPIGPALYSDYSAAVAASSRRRKLASEEAKAEARRPLSNEPISMIQVKATTTPANTLSIGS